MENGELNGPFRHLPRGDWRHRSPLYPNFTNLYHFDRPARLQATVAAKKKQAAGHSCFISRFHYPRIWIARSQARAKAKQAASDPPCFCPHHLIALLAAGACHK
jgi:hypothetical protein